jgi:hypothetical protein
MSTFSAAPREHLSAVHTGVPGAGCEASRTVERDRVLARGREAADRCLIERDIVLACRFCRIFAMVSARRRGLGQCPQTSGGSLAECAAASDRGAATRWTPHCPRSSRELSGDSNARTQRLALELIPWRVGMLSDRPSSARNTAATDRDLRAPGRPSIRRLLQRVTPHPLTNAASVGEA